MIPVVCVLRSGGEYGPEHVERLRRQMFCTSPGLRLTTLTDFEDVPASRPLEHGWPGWWAKLEICAPWIRGPLLYTDLDTDLEGDLEPLVEDATKSIVLRDFYRRADAVQSSLMLLTELDRRRVWEYWSADPHGLMERHWRGGDQLVFEAVLGPTADRWQDRFPGAVLSYKADVRHGRRTDAARVIVYHGPPRPWEVERAAG